MKTSGHNFLLIISLLFFASASLLQNKSLFSQNLVPNPGFEEHIDDSLLLWQQPRGQFYHFEYNSKIAHSGSCINGLCDWGIYPTEYMLVKLTTPLIRDRKYTIAIHTMIKPEDVKYIDKDSSRNMGIYFLKNPIDVFSRIYIVKEPDFRIYVYQDAYWHKAEFEYIASGDENYLIMGRFYDPSTVLKQNFENKYQDYLTELEMLTMEKSTTMKAEMDKIYLKYKQIQDDAWNINAVANPRKQEKLIRAFQKKMDAQKDEIHDKIEEVESEYRDKAKALAKKYGIARGSYNSQHKYRLYFDDISVEPVSEAPAQPEQVIVLNNVFFNTAEWILLPASFTELDKYVGYLKEKTNLKVEISGHTDIVGNDEDNQLLSENRAKAVVEYFIQNEISPERLTYKGYGRTKPIANNETDEGRAKNRRVEMKIIAE